MALQQTIILENGLVVENAYHMIGEEYTNKFGRIGNFMLYTFKDRDFRKEIKEDSQLSKIAIRKQLFEIVDNGNPTVNVTLKFLFKNDVTLKISEGEKLLVDVTSEKDETIEEFITKLNKADMDLVFSFEEDIIIMDTQGRYDGANGNTLLIEDTDLEIVHYNKGLNAKFSDYDVYVHSDSLESQGFNPTKMKYKWLKENIKEFTDAIDILETENEQ